MTAPDNKDLKDRTSRSSHHSASPLMDMLPNDGVVAVDTSSNNETNISSASFQLLLTQLTETGNTSRNLSTSWWNDIPYPGSGYTQLSIILLAFFITCIMILIVIGNLLVCIAILTEKSLKTVQNWFIASLAVSDLLLGCVIMPFSLAYELMGYWIFGQVWCEVRIVVASSHSFSPSLVTRLLTHSLPADTLVLFCVFLSHPLRSIMHSTSFSPQHPSTTYVLSAWIVTGQ